MSLLDWTRTGKNIFGTVEDAYYTVTGTPNPATPNGREPNAVPVGTSASPVPTTPQAKSNTSLMIGLALAGLVLLWLAFRKHR